jgi:hypothetical protein
MVSGGTIPLSEWACLEYRVSMNTPGVANGVITAWINDVEVVNRSDLLLRGASDSGNFNTPSSNIALITTYRQHGHGIGEGLLAIYTMTTMRRACCADWLRILSDL